VRILIGSDGGDRIRYTAAAVQQLTRGIDAEVFVLHVLHPEAGDAPPEAHRAIAAQRRRALAEALSRAGLDATLLIETRAPFVRVYQHMIRRAEELQIDMIVVASKRAGGVVDLILGGVAQELLRRSPVPVLVVRPA
jgi:nucleotide-binding universal stress UspA family protein